MGNVNCELSDFTAAKSGDVYSLKNCFQDWLQPVEQQVVDTSSINRFVIVETKLQNHVWVCSQIPAELHEATCGLNSSCCDTT